MKNLLFVLLLGAVAFVSCSDDDGDGAPAWVKENLRGTYLGTVCAVPTWHRSDTLRRVSYADIDGSRIRLQQLPVASIVDTLFGAGTAATAGVTEAAMDIGYKLYDADASYYPMTYEPTAVEFTVTAADGQHTVDLVFSKGTGSDELLWYYPSSNTLQMWLQTSSVRVDGVRATTTAAYPDSAVSLNFRFPITLYKQP